MIAQILNNGITTENPDSLNRKIRISNLVALLTAGVMFFYTPLYVYYDQPAGVIQNGSFFLSSLVTFFLIHRKRYHQAFVFHVCVGLLYFIAGTLLYGLKTNLQFYMIIMCMITAVLFDNRKTIQAFIAFAIVSFFGLLIWAHFHEPFMDILKQSDTAESLIGNFNLLLLFLIISLFILFFKEEMIQSQKRILEQKQVIEEKNRDITDSISYAQRIQSALLPSRKIVQDIFPENTLFFQPKDLVSGDFYWVFQTETHRFAAVGDCTGHGVPGSMMSVLGINLLREIVENKGIFEPAVILDELRNGIISAFDKEGKGSEYKDGMDLSLVRINHQAKSYVFAGANNPVYHLSEESVEERKADRQPVGFSHHMQPFSQQEFPYREGDSLALFTDGYADQFGGPKNKKFRYQPFRELLHANRNDELERILHTSFENWKGANEQIDDVCVLVIKL